MWSVKSFLSILFVASAHAATLNCVFTGTACPKFNLTSYLTVDDTITVVGAPFLPYTDNVTSRLDLSSISTSSHYVPSMSIKHFPKKIFSIYQNLQNFSIFNGLADAPELATDSVYNCARLEGFSIRGGNLDHIRAGFARSCNKISFIDISTALKTIDENALQGLVGLKYFFMTGNRLKCLSPKLFQYSKELIELRLHQNEFTSLHSQLFIGLTKLSIMMVNVNKINFIPRFNLDTTGTDVSVASLLFEFAENPIHAISPDFLAYLNSTKRIAPNAKYLNLNFKSTTTATPTCVNPSLTASPFTGDIYNIGKNSDWVKQNQTYAWKTTCYSPYIDDVKNDKLSSCGTACNGGLLVNEQFQTFFATLQSCYPEVRPAACTV